MKKKSALLREHQRVNNAQNGVNGIWIRFLANAAAARRWFPLGAKIAALQQPSSGIVRDANLCVRSYRPRCIQLNIEFEFGRSIRGYEPCIAVLQRLEEIGVESIHLDGNTADGDDQVVGLDLCG